jgi:phage terminase large subunit GpA-like protein
VIPFCDAIDDPDCEKIVLVCPPQTGKTEALLDLIGHGLETMPRPIIFFGPSESFVVDIFEPRLHSMLDGVPSLASMIQRVKRE